MAAYSFARISPVPAHRLSTAFGVIVLHAIVIFLLSLGLSQREVPTDSNHAPLPIQDPQFVEPINLEPRVESSPAAGQTEEVASLPDVAPPIESLTPAPPTVPNTTQVAPDIGAIVPDLGSSPGLGSAIGNGGTGSGGQIARPSSSTVAVRARKRSGYISSEDYPRQALAAKAEGTTSARITIAANGSVSACSIAASSGRADFDSTVCNLILKRYRFEPAQDADGKSVSDVRTETFTWILPAND